MMWGDLLAKVARGEPVSVAEAEEVRVIGNALQALTALASKVNPVTGDIIDLTAGSVILDNAGLRVAGNDSFAVLSGPKTYNDESLGDGDVIMGDNTADKANILWDKSTGQLLFRGGTTTQGYIDTDGRALFGAGNVALTSGGVRLTTGDLDINQLKWSSDDSYFPGYIYTTESGDTPNRTASLYITIAAEAFGTGNSNLWLESLPGPTGEKASFYLGGHYASVNTRVDTGSAGSVHKHMVYVHGSAAATQTDGFGMSFDYKLSNAASEATIITGKWIYQWDDISELEASTVFQNYDTSVLVEKIRFDKTGAAKLSANLHIKEQAAAATNIATYGQLWVKNTEPCELWFTDDAGADTKLA